jgi:short-subunit dehydrogenase
MNKTVVITGASKGFGFSLSKEFARRNCNVVMVSRSLPMLLNSRKVILDEFPNSNVVCLSADISKKKTACKISKCALDNFGKVDYWINNAATLLYKYESFNKYNENEIDTIINTNLTGVFYGIREAQSIMKFKGGEIYNIKGSGSYGEKIPGYSLYAISKYPIQYLSEYLYLESSYNNVHIHSINPGILHTDILHSNKNIPGFIVKYFCNSPDKVADYVVSCIVNRSKSRDIDYYSIDCIVSTIIKNFIKNLSS